MRYIDADEAIAHIMELTLESERERDELVEHYEAKLKEAHERIKQLERIVDTYEQVQKEFFIDKAQKEAE